MELMDAIRDRRSIREFQTNPVTREQVEYVLRAGLLAPSTKNRQPWRFVVVEGAQSRAAMVDAMRRGVERCDADPTLSETLRKGLVFARRTLGIMATVPVNIFVLNRQRKTGYPDSFEDMRDILATTQSIGAAIQNMVLAAHELGLGTLWNNNIYYAYDELMEFLRTEDQLVASICLGVPDEAPEARPRKTMKQLTEWWSD